MKVYLFRYGQSSGNANYFDNIGDPFGSRNQQAPGPGLTDKAHERARRLGEHMHMAHPRGESARRHPRLDEEACGPALLAPMDRFEKEAICRRTFYHF